MYFDEQLESPPSPPSTSQSTTSNSLSTKSRSKSKEKRMKPGTNNVVADEMFPEPHFMDFEESSTTSNIFMDLSTNDKYVHNDFFNAFDDIFDEDDLE